MSYSPYDDPSFSRPTLQSPTRSVRSNEGDGSSSARTAGSNVYDDEDDAVEKAWTRISIASTAGQDQFQEIAEAVREKQSKASIICQSIWSFLCSMKGTYLCVGVSSCLLELVFASVYARVGDNCGVFNPEGRCCSCPDINETRMLHQDVPYLENFNAIYYSLLLCIDAVISLAFIVSAVLNENKYQLVCSLVAKIVGLLRSVTDVFLETRHTQTKDAHLAFLSVEFACVIVLCALVPRLLKTWGWKIFRRSGGNPEQIEVYKLYQMVRGMNWLESQASIVLHVLFVMWLRYTREQFWVWFMVVLLEFVSSRQAVHHLKRENKFGCFIALGSKVFCNVYCIIVCVLYFSCRTTFDQSLEQSERYWAMDPYPDMLSIRNSYNGIQCLPEQTAFDDTIVEIMVISLCLMTIFRVAFIVCFFRVLAKFDSGLKDLFYKVSGAVDPNARRANSKRSGKRKGNRKTKNKKKKESGGAAQQSDVEAPWLKKEKPAKNQDLRGAAGGDTASTQSMSTQPRGSINASDSGSSSDDDHEDDGSDSSDGPTSPDEGKLNNNNPNNSNSISSSSNIRSSISPTSEQRNAMRKSFANFSSGSLGSGPPAALPQSTAPQQQQQQQRGSPGSNMRSGELVSPPRPGKGSPTVSNNGSSITTPPAAAATAAANQPGRQSSAKKKFPSAPVSLEVEAHEDFANDGGDW